MNINKKKELLILSYAEFWDMVSFFGTVSILILYLTKSLNFNDQQSYSIYGIYVTLLCALPILGGFINDNFIGDKISLYLGGTLMIIGNVLLCIKNPYYLFVGISLTITGTALLKTTCTNMVGTIYDNSESEKDWAYSIFYAFLNVGAIVGPVLYGLLSNLLDWNYSFLIGSIGLFSSLLLFKFSSIVRYSDEEKKVTANKKIIGFFIIFLCAITSSLLFIFYQFFDYFLCFFVFVIVVLSIMYIKRCSSINRKRISGIIILLTFTVFFFLSSLQVGSSINLFISRFVNVSVFNFKVPETWFVALDPLFLVLSAPIIAKIWLYFDKNKVEVNPFSVVAVGLLFSAVSFMFFWIASINANSSNIYMVIAPLILGFLMIGTGEMIFSPIVLSTISKKSPEGIKNTMMGGWYFFMAIAGYSGSIIDRSMSGVGEQINIFENIFIVITLITLISSVFLFITSSLYKKLF